MRRRDIGGAPRVSGCQTSHFLLASGFTTSCAQSIKRWTGGLKARFFSVTIKAGDLAWYFQVQNPRRGGNVFAVDGRETWLVRYYLRDEEQELGSLDCDRAIRTILGVGGDFCYEVLSHEDFVGRRLLADKFRDRRAFICGDAAHRWPPNGGYGMNAGIADAANLSWLLDSVLKGWASPAILDVYQLERQPITEQVSCFAVDMALKHIELRRETPDEIELPGSAGDALRQSFGKEAYDLNLRSICCGALISDTFTIARRSSATMASRHLRIPCMTLHHHPSQGA